MNLIVCIYKNNFNFWIFGLFFFFYFFIMVICFLFLLIWLLDVIGLNKIEIGFVFFSLLLFVICFQLIFGVIFDKLGLKKYLMWIVIVLLVLIVFFFFYVFVLLLKINIWFGVLSGGVYIGFVFFVGVGVMEVYIEWVSCNSGFEYGKVCIFGCLGWVLCVIIVGMLFSINFEWVFWMGLVVVLLLVVLVVIVKLQVSQFVQVMDLFGVNCLVIDLKMVVCMFCQCKMWMFILYVIGVVCVYDVFDQQFVIFFKLFFVILEVGICVFGFVIIVGEICNVIIMFSLLWIINCIGVKNILLIVGMVMVVRMIGFFFVIIVVEVVVLKMFYVLEVLFLLVGVFKYIIGVFDVWLLVIIYLVGFQFVKQVVVIFFFVFVGNMYDWIGFQDIYMIFGGIVLIVILIFVFMLVGKMKIELLCDNVMIV